MKHNHFIVLILVMVMFCQNSKSRELNKRLNKSLRDYVHPLKFSTTEHTSKFTGGVYEETTTANECSLTVDEKSGQLFTHEIFKHKYNFVHLKLHFIDFKVNETEEVINKNNWIWTYKGENGAHQYLYLPGDFGYLSFGLLWSYTRRKSLPININKSGNCSELAIGSNETDYLVGNALGTMTSKIAKLDDNYNSSYWCYNVRVFLLSSYIYNGCKNSVCTFQTFEYRCCKFYIDFVKRNRVVQCKKEHYEFGALWWMLPIIVGETCFAFCPLMLTKLGIKFKEITSTIRKDKTTLCVRNMTPFAESDDYCDETQDKNNIKYQYLSTKYSNPITFFSTICYPFYGCDLSGPIVSRLLRTWILILPLSLSTVRVIVDYIYAKDIVTEAVMKGALVGFSSIIAGPSAARKHFLYIFNGPITALTIYVVFGCILIVFPRNLEKFLNAGFQETPGQQLLLSKLPLKLKEKWSGLSVKKTTGYHRIHKLFLAQIFMLLHIGFWKHAFTLFYIRWTHIVFRTMSSKLRSRFAAVLASVLILPLYLTFCTIELCFSVIYFLLPVLNCAYALLKAFLIHYFDFFNNRGRFMKCLCYVLFLPMLVLFCICWYIYCLLFFDGMWFLSKITMFTYSGIIAYPKISYGYLILVFMAIYYLTESLNTYGENYRQLLKLCIEACDRYQSKHHDDADVDSSVCNDIRNKYGVKSDLFYKVVDKHLPRRNQVLITVLKFISVVTILTISVELLITFNKFQDLSLVSHVFTVLFICALPKIIRIMCLDTFRNQARRRILRQCILKTVSHYVRQRSREEGDSSDEDIIGYPLASDFNTARENPDTEYCII